jgi:hypothetical protein
MDSAQDFKSLQDNVQKALVSTVKTINRVSNHDIGFQSLANPEVGTRIEESRARLLKITSRLLKASAQAGRVSVPKLETFDDIETLWGAIVDVLDSNFAKTDAALDEFHAQVKRIGHAMATQVESTAAAATPTVCPPTRPALLFLQSHLLTGMLGNTAQIKGHGPDARPSRSTCLQHPEASAQLREEGGQLSNGTLEASPHPEASCTSAVSREPLHGEQ